MGQARGGQSVELVAGGGGDVHAFPMDSHKRPAFVMLPFLHIGLPSSLKVTFSGGVRSPSTCDRLLFLRSL